MRVDGPIEAIFASKEEIRLLAGLRRCESTAPLKRPEEGREGRAGRVYVDASRRPH